MEKKLFVPGRVCLFGEHSDWAGAHRSGGDPAENGYTLLTGTRQGITAVVAPSDQLDITSRLPDGSNMGPERIDCREAALLEAALGGGFFSYIAGVAYYMRQHFGTGGLRMACRMDLPLKKGLSSSAAVCVLTARAFNQVYDLGLTIRGEMEYAYLGEILTGSQCGRMDQGCAFGQSPILMTFNGNAVSVKQLEIAGSFELIIADLGAAKDTRKILSSLNEAFLSDDPVGRGVREYLGEVNKGIVFKAVEALKSGDPPRLGRLMREAQEAFDRHCAPACPSELTAPRLHDILAAPDLQPFIWGGKGIGSQGDGSVQFLARGKEERFQAMDIIEKKHGLSCFSLDM
jgi:galactokinase